MKQYEAIVKQTDAKRWTVRYGSDQEESLESNTALNHLMGAEPCGPVFTDYEVESVKALEPSRKDALAEDVRQGLLARGWKDRKSFPEDFFLSFDISCVRFTLKRLGDLLVLSAAGNGVCLKMIHYPEWRWENLEPEIMNDCNMIVKMVLEEE